MARSNMECYFSFYILDKGENVDIVVVARWRHLDPVAMGYTEKTNHKLDEIKRMMLHHFRAQGGFLSEVHQDG